MRQYCVEMTVRTVVLLIFAAFTAKAEYFDKLLLKFENEDCILGEIGEGAQLKLLTPKAEAAKMLISQNIVLDVSDKDVEAILGTNVNTTEHPVSFIDRLATFNKIEYEYIQTKREGPSHKPVFYIMLKLGNEEHLGIGKNKKDGKKMAALKAIQHTQYRRPELVKKKMDEPNTPAASLNILSQKLGIKVQYFLVAADNTKIEAGSKSIKLNGKQADYLKTLNRTLYEDYNNINVEESEKGPFRVIASVGELEFLGIGYTKQSARHDAAANALKELREKYGDKSTLCSNNDIVCHKDNIKSPITVVYETAEKLGTNVDFELTEESGPPHRRIFKTMCKFDTLTAIGEGPSKKASKSNAAYNMLFQLKHIDHIDIESDIEMLPKRNKEQKKKKKGLISDVTKLFNNAKKSFHSLVDTLHKTIEGSLNNYEDVPSKQIKTKKSGSSGVNYKDTLLQIGVASRYINLHHTMKGFASLVSLNTKPPYVCLGKATTIESAENIASFFALKFIKKHDVLLKGNQQTEHCAVHEVQSDDYNVLDITATETND